MAGLVISMEAPLLSKSSSTENETVRNDNFLEAIEKRLYFCTH